MTRPLLIRRREFLAGGVAAGVVSPHLSSAQARVRLVATFSILGDLLHQLAGDRSDIAVLVGPDSDAHNYQLKPTDVKTILSAQLLLSNGMGFETWLRPVLATTALQGKHVVATNTVDPLLRPVLRSEAALPMDPHCWQDAMRFRQYARNAAAGLSEVDPANAGVYRERLATYVKRLEELDAWTKAQIARVPMGKRRVITGHDAFRYFSQAYGVEFHAPRGMNLESEPSARDVALLIAMIREKNIKALFMENLTNPRLIEQVARDSGAVAGPPLYSDALSAAGGPAATYVAMMTYNVTLLVEGMLRN